jgi:light-regulated signal transduction histidine kinase (bacteriophytochrome)
LEQFAYVASHDLQEPLRMIASYTALLRKRYGDRLDAEAQEFIQYAVDGAVRLQALIHDLLAYSRLGTRGAPFDKVVTLDTLHGALRNLQMAVDEHCALVTHDALPPVHGDAVQIVQVWQNLLSNAIKFRGTESPKIHITAQSRPQDVLFAVQDNGMGIAPEHAERIFVIFQRLHSREKYSGTGIGLAICKKVIERHGGRIWVESRPEVGATFFFTLPHPQADGGGKVQA